GGRRVARRPTVLDPGEAERLGALPGGLIEAAIDRDGLRSAADRRRWEGRQGGYLHEGPQQQLTRMHRMNSRMNRMKGLGLGCRSVLPPRQIRPTLPLAYSSYSSLSGFHSTEGGAVGGDGGLAPAG